MTSSRFLSDCAHRQHFNPVEERLDMVGKEQTVRRPECAVRSQVIITHDELDCRLRRSAAFVEELPGANAEGASLDEARENLQAAIELTLEANRALAEEALAGKRVIRENLPVAR
jgi:hypothetical protein